MQVRELYLSTPLKAKFLPRHRGQTTAKQGSGVGFDSVRRTIVAKFAPSTARVGIERKQPFWLLRYYQSATRGVPPHSYRTPIESGVFAPMSSARHYVRITNRVLNHHQFFTRYLAFRLALFSAEARVGLQHSPADQECFIVPRGIYLSISWHCSDKRTAVKSLFIPQEEQEANSCQMFRLRPIEFRFPVSQRFHHRGEIGRLAEEHFLHPGIIFPQRAHAFIGRVRYSASPSRPRHIWPKTI